MNNEKINETEKELSVLDFSMRIIKMLVKINIIQSVLLAVTILGFLLFMNFTTF